MMEKTYVFELIKSLSVAERREFELFVTSRYFNRGKQATELTTLLRTILKFISKPGDASLEKNVMYECVFPGAPWVEGKLEKLMVALNKLLRTFLLIQHYFQPENEFQQELDWGAQLHHRGFDLRYQRLLDKLKANSQQEYIKNDSFFLHRLQLEHAIYDYETYNNRKKGDLNIPQVLHNLDIYYHLFRLEHLNYFLLQNKVTNLEISDGLAIALQENPLPERYLQESSYLLIQFKIFCLLQAQNPGLSEFQELYELLKQHEPHLEKSKLEEYYAYLRNVCVLLINSGAEELYQVLHQIQRDNLERGLLYLEGKQGKLSPSAVLNLVDNGLIVQNYAWVAEFLESHQDRIIGDNETRDLYRFNRARYLFAVGRFEEALDYVPPASPYVDYHLAARRLELRIYYELDSELLPYKVDAFKMYLSRVSQKFLSPELRRRNGDFANVLFQLIHLPPGDRVRARRILQRIEENKGVSERKWLLEKVRQLT